MKMRIQLLRLAVRWLLNSLGLWFASGLMSGIEFSGGIMPVLIAGLILALVNAILKPIVILLSLPAILLSLGLFILFINGFMVFLVDKLYNGLTIDGYFLSLLAGIVIGLVNYVVTVSLEGIGENNE